MLHPCQLLLPRIPFRSAMQRLLQQPHLTAWGLLQRDPQRQPPAFLASTLDVRSSQECGGEHLPPLADWLIVLNQTDFSEAALQQSLAQWQPSYLQHLVVLVVGLGPKRQGWRGWVIHQGKTTELQSWRLIGSGMLQLDRQPEPLQLETSERWSRCRGALGESLFQQVSRSSVAIVGCSRTGNLVASQLAALGVRRLVLLDGDVVEEHNLDSMLLSTEADLTLNKAIALGQRLVAFRSDLVVQACPYPLEDRRTDETLRDLDLIITCVDADAPRLRAAHWANSHLVPHLDVGSSVTRNAQEETELLGDVRLLLPRDGCIRCVGGLRNLAEAETMLRRPRVPWGKKSVPWDNDGRLGSLVTLNLFSVATAVQTWLDMLSSKIPGSIWHRLLWDVTHGLVTTSAIVGPGANCPLCEKQKKVA